MTNIPRCSKIWLFFLANVLFCRSAFPQQGMPKLPSTKPAIGAHWIITYENKETKPPDKPSSDKSSSEKSSKMRRKHKDEVTEQKPAKSEKSLQSEEYRITAEAASVTKKYADSSERVIYIIHGVAYQKNAATQNVMALSTGGTENGEIIFTEHYPGCEWIQARYYVDTEEKNEHRCLHFRRPGTAKQTTEADQQTYDPFLTSLDCETWIDAETGLPVSFRQGTTISGTYQHESSQEDPVVIPEEITRAIKRYNGES